MQGTVEDANPGALVERVGNMADEPRGVGRGRGPVLADRGVERLSGHVLERQVRHRLFDARVDRRRQAGRWQFDSDQTLELLGEPSSLFGREVEGEYLDRHQTVVVRIVRAKDRAEDTGADLVQQAKPAERRWR